MGDHRYEYHTFQFAGYSNKVCRRERKGYVRMCLYSIVFVSLIIFA